MRVSKQILIWFSCVLLAPEVVAGNQRLEALAQIESGNNDLAIGPQREVSRYQILPVLWRQAKILWRPTDAASASLVVNWIMQARCEAFEARYHRPPDDFEYYILWHRPACLIGRSVARPITAAEAERGRRFANLCRSGTDNPDAGMK